MKRWPKIIIVICAAAALFLSVDTCFCLDPIESKKEFYDKGMKCAMAGNFFDAWGHFQKALSLDELCREAKLDLLILDDVLHDKIHKDEVIFRFKGVNYTNIMLFDEAIAEFNQAIAIKSNYADIYNCRGIAYNGKGLYDLAIHDFDEAIELNPKIADFYYNRAFAHSLKSNYVDAVTNLNKAIELDTHYNEAHIKRADLLSKMGQYKLAISDYTMALEEMLKVYGEDDPDLYIIYYNRGKDYKLIGKYDDAISDMAKTLEISPKYVDAYIVRAITYSLKKLDNFAEADFLKAMEIDGNRAEIFYHRGNHYSNKGEYMKAKLDYENAISKKADYTEAYFKNALNCEAANYPEHIQDAIKSYKSFIVLAPDRYRPYVEYARERIRQLTKFENSRTYASPAH